MRFVLPGAVGIVLALLKIMSAFFGELIFFGLDIVIGLMAAFFARRVTRRWWVSATLIAGPACLWTVFVLVALGPARLAEGVGRWWVISLMSLPISAMTGAYIAHRRFSFDH